MSEIDRITYFAETDARNKRVKFGIKSRDRNKHLYVIGKTGMGKSTMLENMAIQDIQNGEGLAFIDPHGKTAELLLDYVPEERIKDVLYFAPFDTDYPISFNVMEDVGPDKRHLVSNGLMSAFKKIWVDAWSARMEYILNNILLALLEYPDSTLLGVNRMLADKDYRKKVVDNITDVSVKSFWVDEFAKYGDRYMQEAGAAIQNKVGQFIANPLVRNIIGQPRSTFDLRQMIDNRKIVILNLSKGRVGEANANLLGSMFVTKVYLAAMSRADVPEPALNKLPNFFLYVDEFQSFANESFADILSEARKYKLNLTIAHQYIEQMSDEVRAAVFGNVGTMTVFRVGAYDAEVLEKEFAPTFTAEDMVNLGFTQIYLKLMIDGVASAPFSASTLPPITRPTVQYRDEIILHTRRVYAKPRSAVEESIRNWSQAFRSAPLPERRSKEVVRTGYSNVGKNRVEEFVVPPRTLRSDVVMGKKQGDKKEEVKIPARFAPPPAPSNFQKQASPVNNFPSRRFEPKKIQFLEPKAGVPTARDPKVITPENKASLRQALSAVLKDVPKQDGIGGEPQRGERAEEIFTAEKSRQHIQRSTNIPHQPRGSADPNSKYEPPKPKEVPAEVLKKVLNINDK